MSDRTLSLYGASGQWRRWEPESFDTPTPEEAAAAEEAARGEETVALPDPDELLAEIERLREAARVRGHAEGYAAGHAAGKESGLQQGLELGLKEGRDKGYAEGYTRGTDEARAEVEKLTALLDTTASSLAHIEAEAGDALLNLALSIARQVLRSTLDAEPHRIQDLIREVVHVDGEPQGILQLRLNPADMDLVEAYLQQDGSVARWTLHADETIERGGCIVTTALGSIDATLQTRWERVVSSLGVSS
jgi:Flagellar biosynthesis/type III secretory pathway protein